MILTARTISLLVMMALATGGAAWGVHGVMAPTGDTGVDYGLDTNGNGTFDWLVVEAAPALPEAGTWDVYADLSTLKPPTTGSCGVGGLPPPVPILAASEAYGPIAWVYERYFFPAGPATVRMAFAGTDIARAGVDGPYVVHARLSLGGFPYPGIRAPEPIPGDGFLEWNYTTKGYAVGEFESPARPAFFPGPHADASVDMDADGLADFLEMTADVQVNVAGHYSLYGSLSEKAASDVVRMIAYGSADVDLATADTQVLLRFRGDQIRRTGVDGPWDFSLTLYGPVDDRYLNGTIPADSGFLRPGIVFYPEMLCGSTATYRADAFDDTPEFLRYTGRFEEATPDEDADGLHDALVLRAEVDVLVPAAFDVSGVLLPVGGSVEVARTAGWAWLPEGRQWVEFVFPGPQIRGSGVDGPYAATLSLTPMEGGIDPVTTFVTLAYRATDFDDGSADVVGYWIGNLTVTPANSSLRISAVVVRGNDLLTVVLEDTFQVTVTDASGAVVGSFKERVSLPSGGSEQAFSFIVDALAAGTYTITAVLGPPDQPVDTRTVVVSV